MSMKRRRWVIISILAVIGAGIAWGLFESIRGRRALRAYKAGLSARGEKLEVKELTPFASPASVRAAGDFMLAAAELRVGNLDPGSLSAAMQYVSPGVARIGAAQPDIRSRGGTLTWDELARQLDANAPALEQIRRALISSRLNFGLDYAQGYLLLLPHLAQMRNDLRAGRLDAALRNLRAMLALTGSLHEERLVVSQIQEEQRTAEQTGRSRDEPGQQEPQRKARAEAPASE